MRNMASAGIKSWSTSVMALGQLQPNGNASRPTLITIMIMMMLMPSGWQQEVHVYVGGKIL